MNRQPSRPITGLRNIFTQVIPPFRSQGQSRRLLVKGLLFRLSISSSIHYSLPRLSLSLPLLSLLLLFQSPLLLSSTTLFYNSLQQLSPTTLSYQSLLLLFSSTLSLVNSHSSYSASTPLWAVFLSTPGAIGKRAPHATPTSLPAPGPSLGPPRPVDPRGPRPPGASKKTHRPLRGRAPPRRPPALAGAAALGLPIIRSSSCPLSHPPGLANGPFLQFHTPSHVSALRSEISTRPSPI